jgi:hypothetical protein
MDAMRTPVIGRLRPREHATLSHGAPLSRTSAASSGRAAAVLALQRSCGNRAVQRMLGGEVSGPQPASPDVEEAIRRTRGSGSELRPHVRTDMEEAFGADFGEVRVHTDVHADALNRSLSAVAFTTGRDVYFRHGAYDPEGPAGRRLLAHELTHVVQQSGSVPDGGLVIGPPDDVFEQEAERVADSVTRAVEPGRSAAETPDAAAPAGAVQRMCAECEEEMRAP